MTRSSSATRSSERFAHGRTRPLDAALDARRPSIALPRGARWEDSVLCASGYLYVAGDLRASATELNQARDGLSSLSADLVLNSARACSAYLLASTAQTLGSLKRVERLLKLKLTVPEGLSLESPALIRRETSELLDDLLGQGRSAQSPVVTAAVLPVGVVMEAAAIVRVKSRERKS